MDYLELKNLITVLGAIITMEIVFLALHKKSKDFNRHYKIATAIFGPFMMFFLALNRGMSLTFSVILALLAFAGAIYTMQLPDD